ncbi:heparinase II/III-family protein [Reichenbachiella carrageenanivorans]|uniref:Heparinase II/III-family protein n=1 Tax=Reichenbachiella carrageenanivorans TaxID=2979869 RepID=A0ABY6D0Y4_9BACT|nr:heparinase II/III-family protein [Reichenbachiella carrageenanivorans]UXX79822.1 heparinase II/III-family protein [Reichenbachiella carrageenanivorans]
MIIKYKVGIEISKRVKSYGLLSICLLIAIGLCAQSNQTGSKENHPRIYVNNVKAKDFARAVKKVAWKVEIIEKKKEKVDGYIELCKSDPNWLVSRLQMNWKTKHSKVFLHGGDFSHSEGEAPVPTVRYSGTRDWATDYIRPSIEEIQPYLDDERGMYLKKKETKEMEWVHPSKSGHIIEGINRQIMTIAEDAAFLYWFTGDDKYAEFVLPVYDTYMKGMYYREPPVDLDNTRQQQVSGLATFEVIHEQIVVSLSLIYDFMYEYLEKSGHDRGISTAVFQKWGDQIIKNGIPDNNWNFFQARFLTYIGLALDSNEYFDNGKGQQYYLDHTFSVSTDRQIALKEAILNYDQQTGIWPESAAYSMHVTETLLNILTVLDNATNDNELENFPVIEKATLATFQYLFPNGRIVAFGDSGHKSLPSASFEYLIANYRKYGKREKEKEITALYQGLLDTSDRGRGLFELFFYVDELVETSETDAGELIAHLTSPTFYAPNVSWFAQRMGTGTDATMVSTFGAFGNHAHANGIGIELFANNYVLAPDMGPGPSYWHQDHRQYYARYPAHNTVVVDGISDSRTMRVSQPFSLDNCFPESEDRKNIFDQITFSKVSFVEPTTLANQQRLTAIINGTSGKAYVLDVFRSERPNAENQQHDYFFHGLGQSLSFLDENDERLSMTTSTKLKAPNFIPAYDYFTDEKSVSTSQSLNAQFKLEHVGNPTSLMKVWMKGGENRIYFSVNGPKAKALSKESATADILNEKIPTLVIRNNAEAWHDPFVAVFNPFLEESQQVISDVTFFEGSKNKSAQIIQVTHDHKETKDHIVVTTSENDMVKTAEFYQKGLLSIMRETDSEMDFIFVAGATQYSNKGWEILSVREALNLSIQRNESGFEIQNNNAVLIGVPKRYNPESIQIYEDGKLIETRQGMKNRNDPDRIDFRLEKAFQKAIIVLKHSK